MTDRLAGIDLVVFDKDGTLIEFHAMWSGWAVDLADRLAATTGRDIHDDLFAMLGYDPIAGRAIAGGRLAATPMARLRDLTGGMLRDHGLDGPTTSATLETVWHAPDPVALARPVADLPALLATIRASGRRVAVATTDDREPTERTLDALGISAFVDATVCADDGVAPKPASDMVVKLATDLGVAPDRVAVIGDSVADLTMGRAAGVARCYGVLTGIGTREDLVPLADEVLASIADLVRA